MAGDPSAGPAGAGGRGAMWAAHRRALLAAALYAVLAGVWIWGTDRALVEMGLGGSDTEWVQSLKGTLFVAVTAGLLYWLVLRSVLGLVRSRESLRVSDQRHRLAATAAQIGTWSVDIQTGRMQGDPWLARIITGRDEWPGAERDAWRRYVHPEDYPRVAEAIAPCYRGETDRFHADYRVVHEGGQVRWVHSRASPVTDDRGRVVAVAGVTMDVTGLREAHAAREASESRLRRIADSLPGVVYEATLRPGGTFVCHFVSAGIEELAGEPAEAFVNRELAIDGRVHPEDRERLRAATGEAVRTGRAVRREFRIAHPSGEHRWVRDVARPTPLPDGSVLWHGVLLDISEVKQAEAALRDSEERYRLLVEHSPEPMFVHAEGRIAYANAAMAALMGAADAAALAGHPVERMVPPGFAGVVRDRWRELAQGRTTPPLDQRIVRLDGSTVDVEIAGTPCVFNGRRAVQALARDVTHRRAAQEALRRSEARLSAIIEHTPNVAIHGYDADGRVLFWNGAAERLFGVPRDRAVGRTLGELIPDPFLAERFLLALREAASPGGAAGPSEREFTNHAGERRVVLSSVFAMPGAGDEGPVFVCTDVDITGRKHAEAELERFFTLSLGLLCIADPRTGVYRRVNPAFAATLGYTEAELTGRPFIDFVHPEDAARTRAALHEVRHAGDSAGFENRYRHADGSYRWLSWRSSLAPDGLVYASARDVTDARRAADALRDSERRLRESEALLRAVLESLPVGIILADGDGALTEHNEEARRIWGGELPLVARDGYARYKASWALTGEPLGPDDWAIARTLRTGRPVLGDELDIERFDGTRGTILASSALVRGDGDRVLAVVTSLVDITERRRVEAALRDSEARWRSLIDNIPDTVLLLEPDGRILWINRTADGVSREEAMSSTIYDWQEAEGRGVMRDAMSRVLSTGSPVSYEVSWTDPRGRRRWFASRLGPILHQGRVERLILVATDVTERKRAELWLAGEGRVLEMLAKDVDLGAVLAELCRAIEAQESGLVCSVLLLDKDGRTLRLGAAPGLPDGYNRAIDGLAAGPEAGSCGTAVHRRDRVVVEDIATDPLWASFRDLALPHGLRACWSEPILTGDGVPLGALAMYYKASRRPAEHELELLGSAARLAALAIERTRSESELRSSREHLRLAMRAARMGAWEHDLRTDAVSWSEEVYDIFGVAPGEFRGTYQDFLSRLHPEEVRRLRVEGQIRYADGAEFRHEYRAIRPGDGTVWLEARGTVVRDESGAPVRMTGVVLDVTERKRAEEALRLSEATQRALLAAIPDLMFRMSKGGVYLDYHAPDAAELLVEPERFLGRPVAEVLPARVARPTLKAIADALRTGRTQTFEYETDRDGHPRFWEVRVARVGPEECLVLVRDVTEQRLAQRHQDMMMAELDHRVKNNLAAVVSLAEQSARSAATFEAFHEAFMSRVRALVRMHSVLAATRWRGADLGGLVRQSLEAYSNSGSIVHADGPPLLLSPRAGQALAITLNELATNAAKYGALSVPGGRVAVTWTVVPASEPDAPRTLRLTWAESDGPPVQPPSRRGFGSELIEGAIAYELRGKVDLAYAPQGVRCEIELSLDPVYLSGQNPDISGDSGSRGAD